MNSWTDQVKTEDQDPDAGEGEVREDQDPEAAVTPGRTAEGRSPVTGGMQSDAAGGGTRDVANPQDANLTLGRYVP
jgi:hypothetical protein